MVQFEPHSKKKRTVKVNQRTDCCHFAIPFLSLYFVSLCFLLAVPAYAGSTLPTTNPLSSSQQIAVNQKTFDRLPSELAQSRDLLGNTATAIGMGLDSLFGTPDKNRSNRSTLILRSGIFFDDFNQSSLFNDISFRADLPSTSKRLQLFIRAQREDNIGDEEGTSVKDTPDNDLTRRSIESGDAGLFIRLIRDIPNSQWQNILDAGVTASGLDLDFISYLRVSRSYQLRDWLIQPEPTIIWGPENGLGLGFNFHAKTRLDAETTLQSSTHTTHYFETRTNYFSHGWQLIKHLSPDLRAAYNLRLFTNSESDSTVETLEISAALRRRIHDNWLFFNVIPASRHKADNDYQRDFSITVQFEAKFGSRYE